jgi:hypothetical protein
MAAAPKSIRQSAHSGSSSPGASDIRAPILVALVLGLSSNVGAQEQDPLFEITPFAGFRTGGDFDIDGSSDSYGLDDSSSFGLILNLREAANTQWEVLYSQQSTEAELSTTGTLQSSVDLDIHVLQVGGTYQAMEYGILRPYVALTLGGTHVRSESDSDTFFSGSLGLGLQFNPDARVGVRLEARAYGTVTSSSTDLFCSTGPDQNICAVRLEGNMLGQIEALLGVVMRF